MLICRSNVCWASGARGGDNRAEKQHSSRSLPSAVHFSSCLPSLHSYTQPHFSTTLLC